MFQSPLIKKCLGKVDFVLLSVVLSSVITTNQSNTSAVNGLDNKWNEINFTRKEIKKCLEYIPLYRNEILFFCKYLKNNGNLLLIIGETGIELLFGMLEKLNPLFNKEPAVIFPSKTFRAYPQIYILWRAVRFLI